MSQPVKLSDSLVLDARLAGGPAERSIAGQVEYWARMGRAVEPLRTGRQAAALCKRDARQSVIDRLRLVDTPEGRKKVHDYFRTGPWPRFEPHPETPGLLIRVEEDGRRVTGRFVNREFRAVRVPKKRA